MNIPRNFSLQANSAFDDLETEELDLSGNDAVDTGENGLFSRSGSVENAGHSNEGDDDDLLRDDLELFRAERNGIILSAVRASVQEPIGLAYYSELDRIVYIGETNSIESVALLKNRFSMSLALTSARPGDPLYETLRMNELGPTPYRVNQMKRLEYDDRNCRTLLQSVIIESIPELRVASGESDSLETRQTRRFTWSSLIDFSKRTTVMALTGLLNYLIRNLKHEVSDSDEPQDDDEKANSVGGALCLKALKLIDATGLVYVDELTLDGLQIFVRECHPGLGRNREKEGISLYGLLNQSCTHQGAKLLHQWLRHPTFDKSVLNDRLDHVEFFTRTENEDLLVQLRNILSQIRRIDRSVSRFYNRVPRASDWRALFACLQSTVSMHATIVGHREQLMRLHHRSSNVARSQRGGPRLPRLLEEIGSANLEELQVLNGLFVALLDLDALLGRGRRGSSQPQIRVRPGGDATLDELRARLAVIDSFLAETLAEDLASGVLPPVFSRINYCCIPHVGFLVVVPIEEVNAVNEETLASLPQQQRFGIENSVISASAAAVAASAGLTVQFKTAEHVFFSNRRTRELDEELGDLHTQAAVVEREILEELAQQVMLASNTIEWFSNRMAELDVLLSLAVVARELNLVRPELQDSSQLVIQDGRHIVFELCVEQFIPNGIAMTKEDGFVHIITGPNGSGKSVLLKQVGIITYLAHIGSFVPASRAVIGLCDQIFYIGTSEGSVLNAYSTFATDVLRTSFALRTATNRSLLLLDEFGVGTNSNDGIALCAALINHFDQLGQNETLSDADPVKSGCPRVVLTTHFHEMSTLKLISESNNVRFNCMKFIVNQIEADNQSSTSSSDTGSAPAAARATATTVVVPVFKLTRGWTDHSYGFSCALSAGLPRPIVERAKQVVSNVESRTPIKPLPNGYFESLFNPKVTPTAQERTGAQDENQTDNTSDPNQITRERLGEMKTKLQTHAKLVSTFVRAIPDLIAGEFDENSLTASDLKQLPSTITDLLQEIQRK